MLTVNSNSMALISTDSGTFTSIQASPITKMSLAGAQTNESKLHCLLRPLCLPCFMRALLRSSGPLVEPLENGHHCVSCSTVAKCYCHHMYFQFTWLSFSFSTFSPFLCVTRHVLSTRLISKFLEDIIYSAHNVLQLLVQ